MYLLYLDESGNPLDGKQQYFVLGAVCVPEFSTHWLSSSLDQVAETISPDAPRSLELHAAKIWSGSEPPWQGMNKPQRRQVISNTVNTLRAAYPSTCLFACAVHKASFAGHDPLLIAFEQILSRFDLLLRRLYAQGENQRGMVIVDKTSSEAALQSLTTQFRSTGTRWGKIANLAEVPVFVDSRASRIIQLADHVAYAVFRYYESADATFINPILARFDQEGGKLHGLLHMQNVEPCCMCQACMSRRVG